MSALVMLMTAHLLHGVGGVKNATLRYDLPPPPLAVRNLVRCPVMLHLHTAELYVAARCRAAERAPSGLSV